MIFFVSFSVVVIKFTGKLSSGKRSSVSFTDNVLAHHGWDTNSGT